MKVNWMDIQSVSELKALGTLKEVKKMLADAMACEGLVTGTSFDQLFQKLVSLQKIVQTHSSHHETPQTPPVSSEEIYFNSSAHEYLFYLLELEGELRMNKLGITRQHFSNPKLAKQWYHAIAKQIHPDICHHPKATLAMSELSQLFNEMSGD